MKNEVKYFQYFFECSPPLFSKRRPPPGVKPNPLPPGLWIPASTSSLYCHQSRSDIDSSWPSKSTQIPFAIDCHQENATAISHGVPSIVALSELPSAISPSGHWNVSTLWPLYTNVKQDLHGRQHLEKSVHTLRVRVEVGEGKWLLSHGTGRHSSCLQALP